METATTAILAFNLLCTGTMTTAGTAKPETKPYAYEYRIDGSSGQWCVDNCKRISAIYEVQPAEIILENSTEMDAGDALTRTKNVINRETGAQVLTATVDMRGGKFAINWRGQCVRKPFSGFPKLETKF